MWIVKRTVVATVAGALMLGGIASTAMAGGTDGGDFKCSLSGVPGLGHVTSQYYHPSRDHYATALGRGRETSYASADENAYAKVGRSISGNKCFYGFN